MQPGVEAREARASRISRAAASARSRVVGLRQRRAEDGHHAVALVGDDRAAVREDRG